MKREPLGHPRLRSPTLLTHMIFVDPVTLWFRIAHIIALSLGLVSNVVLCSGVGYHLWYYRLFRHQMYHYAWVPYYCNNIFSRHICNNISVTTIEADTSAKCNTVVHDNICGNKIIIMIVFSWYYLLTPPLGQDMTQGQAGFNRFLFRVFLLLD